MTLWQHMQTRTSSHNLSVSSYVGWIRIEGNLSGQ
jgi:hypothetical protein